MGCIWLKSGAWLEGGRETFCRSLFVTGTGGNFASIYFLQVVSGGVTSLGNVIDTWSVD